jgi:hypothetical protein
MSFLPASRTKRNLFKIASLGLAGLLAGLLSGCNDSPDTSVSASYTHVASDSYNPNASAEAQPLPLPKSIEATQLPALRHPPSTRSLQYGSVRTTSQVMVPNGRNRS